LEKLNQISKLIDNVEKETKGERNNIIKIGKEKDKLKKKLQSRINVQFGLLENNAINDFYVKLKEGFIKSFKTNLNGEASFTLSKGQYYLFGIAKVGQSNIIWNLPLNFENNDHYIELSNDNAFSIDDERLVVELLEALIGLKTNT